MLIRAPPMMNTFEAKTQKWSLGIDVQLLTPQPHMRGARIELHGFVKAVANNGLHGRVVQRHDDGTVSVAFGCETGERSPPAAAAPRWHCVTLFFAQAR